MRTSPSTPQPHLAGAHWHDALARQGRSFAQMMSTFATACDLAAEAEATGHAPSDAFERLCGNKKMAARH
ncbi:hypothetical protein L0F51_12805 [Afifella sp. H1R]|uniref:hypothetical protein n=1 Tax=Afifella sp. H1R TaxID=2908841 RepID=UPI001F43522E|nr:hypothetical protein [Afifella sp. H1R]MCF1504629.1 hypothetical protein [Afifella sp. H1R]